MVYNLKNGNGFEREVKTIRSLIPTDRYITIDDLEKSLGIGRRSLILILSIIAGKGELEYKDPDLGYLDRFRRRNGHQ